MKFHPVGSCQKLRRPRVRTHPRGSRRRPRFAYHRAGIGTRFPPAGAGRLNDRTFIPRSWTSLVSGSSVARGRRSAQLRAWTALRVTAARPARGARRRFRGPSIPATLNSPSALAMVKVRLAKPSHSRNMPARRSPLPSVREIDGALERKYGAPRYREITCSPGFSCSPTPHRRWPVATPATGSSASSGIRSSSSALRALIAQGPIK